VNDAEADPADRAPDRAQPGHPRRAGDAGPRRRGTPRTSYELIDLWHLRPQSERYSYIFQGNAQVLDHILASPSLLRDRPEFDAVHMNSEFTEEQQSDHDPPLARFELDY